MSLIFRICNIICYFHLLGFILAWLNFIPIFLEETTTHYCIINSSLEIMIIAVSFMIKNSKYQQ